MRVVTDTEHFDVVVGSQYVDHGHFVTGQRPGLVGADDCHRPQRLDRRQTTDNGIALRHALDTDGQRDGDDGRQSLGDGRNRQADRSQEHVAGTVVAQGHAKDERSAGNGENGSGQPAAEDRELAQEWRRQGMNAGEEGAYTADLGFDTRGHHDPEPLAVGDQRPGEGETAAVANDGSNVYGIGLLAHRDRLTGQ